MQEGQLRRDFHGGQGEDFRVLPKAGQLRDLSLECGVKDYKELAVAPRS